MVTSIKSFQLSFTNTILVGIFAAPKEAGLFTRLECVKR